MFVFFLIIICRNIIIIVTVTIIIIIAIIAIVIITWIMKLKTIFYKKLTQGNISIAVES